LLGIEEIEKPEELKPNGGIWLKLGAVDLHIGIQDGIEFNKLDMHLAYEVDNLMALRAELEAAGVPLDLGDTAIPDFDRFKIRDPFGNLIEFVQPR
jgi:catechol 2,3-dioxygenase-like lactoylglutathione lyase family enzyme